jgi:hypothetical protein
MGRYEILLIVAVVLVLFGAKWFPLTFMELRKQPAEVRSFFRWLATILGLVIVLAVVYAFQHAR